jgi:hypothetical protein
MEQKTLQVYKSNINSCKFIFKSGVAAHFVAGRYVTDKKSEIDELDAEVEQGNPHIFRDKNEMVMDSNSTDPLDGLRKKHIAEYLAQQAELAAGTRDMGSTAQAAVAPASSKVLAGVSAVVGKK